MYCLNKICEQIPSVEQLIYKEFGYDNVNLLVGNSPGHLAGRALATGLGYIALKRIDQYTNEKVIEAQAQGHIRILERSGEKLDKSTLQDIYKSARNTHSPSILSRAEDLAVGVASNVVKQAVIAVKDSLEKK